MSSELTSKGRALKTRIPNDKYRDNFDKIFRKSDPDKTENDNQGDTDASTEIPNGMDPK